MRRTFKKNYIKNRGQQFIWIPYVHDKVNLENTDIKSIANYFTFVFVQPHYYQRWRDYYTGDLEGSPNEYPYLTDGIDALVNILKWIWSIPNGYIEMEVDNKINSYLGLINKACDYVEAQKRATGFIWPQRAYYYNANINNVGEVRNQCPEW